MAKIHIAELIQTQSKKPRREAKAEFLSEEAEVRMFKVESEGVESVNFSLKTLILFPFLRFRFKTEHSWIGPYSFGPARIRSTSSIP